jgi:N-acetylmuramic acid 6-phosphate etherase
MISTIAGCDEATARDHLLRAEGSTKIAILLASGAGSAQDAQAMLDRSGQALRPALKRLQASQA